MIAFRQYIVFPYLTQVIGPMHQPNINATMGRFLQIVSKAGQARNDSMSFVDGNRVSMHMLCLRAPFATRPSRL